MSSSRLSEDGAFDFPSSSKNLLLVLHFDRRLENYNFVLHLSDPLLHEGLLLLLARCQNMFMHARFTIHTRLDLLPFLRVLCRSFHVDEGHTCTIRNDLLGNRRMLLRISELGNVWCLIDAAVDIGLARQGLHSLAAISEITKRKSR